MPCTRNSVWLPIAIERPYLYASACVAKDFESRLAPSLRTPQASPSRTTYTSFFIFTFQAFGAYFFFVLSAPTRVRFYWATPIDLPGKIRYTTDSLVPTKKKSFRGLLLCCELEGVPCQRCVLFHSQTSQSILYVICHSFQVRVAVGDLADKRNERILRKAPVGDQLPQYLKLPVDRHIL